MMIYRTGGKQANQCRRRVVEPMIYRTGGKQSNQCRRRVVEPMMIYRTGGKQANQCHHRERFASQNLKNELSINCR
jgi:hypothetical protein